MLKHGDTVHILGVPYKIYEEDNPEHNGCEADGLCYVSEPKIVIRKSLAGRERIYTELHEMLHAIFTRAGIDNTSLGPDLEHLLVHQIALVLAENFRFRLKSSTRK